METINHTFLAMERIRVSHKSLDVLLESLEKILFLIAQQTDQELIEALKDGAFRRFVYCTDELFRFLQIVLKRNFGKHITPPKKILQEACNLKLINENEFNGLLKTIDDRNYMLKNDHFAAWRDVIIRIPTHFKLMKLVAIKQMGLLEKKQG